MNILNKVLFGLLCMGMPYCVGMIEKRPSIRMNGSLKFIFLALEGENASFDVEGKPIVFFDAAVSLPKHDSALRDLYENRLKGVDFQALFVTDFKDESIPEEPSEDILSLYTNSDAVTSCKNDLFYPFIQGLHGCGLGFYIEGGSIFHIAGWKKGLNDSITFMRFDVEEYEKLDKKEEKAKYWDDFFEKLSVKPTLPDSSSKLEIIEPGIVEPTPVSTENDEKNEAPAGAGNFATDVFTKKSVKSALKSGLVHGESEKFTTPPPPHTFFRRFGFGIKPIAIAIAATCSLALLWHRGYFNSFRLPLKRLFLRA